VSNFIDKVLVLKESTAMTPHLAFFFSIPAQHRIGQ